MEVMDLHAGLRVHSVLLILSWDAIEAPISFFGNSYLVKWNHICTFLLENQ